MMSRERWQRIKTIFQAAQECAPAERSGFLDEACGNDESVRREVESLLAADQTNEDFLVVPAYEFVAGMLAEEQAELAAGTDVGPYKILSSLGAGGMSEVYLAQDARLGRRIALKLISADFAKDERRVRRFEQEARAASLINHPNVCMIHDIGRTDNGRHFIAMEHVDGMTLRELMERRRLQPPEALDVAIQVAAALAAAHAVGIVHRDIKPENIMLRRDGYIKVLDFGIAKLREKIPKRQNLHEAPTVKVRTEAGMLMGTVLYMSPEQLRETPVDERTDLWSLGVVLYEMVTGTTLFEAPTTNDVIALILARPPIEFAFPDSLPPEFQEVIRKAVTRDRAYRYQNIKELASDLKSVRRELRRQKELKAAPELLSQRTLGLEFSDGKKQPKPKPPGNSSIWFRLKSNAISTADFLLTEIREHKKAAIFTGVTALFAASLLAPGLARLIGRAFRNSVDQQLGMPFQIKMTPLTNSGTSVCAVISADGKYVAHAEKKDGLQELLLTGIATHSTSTIIPPADVAYHGINFSPDGNYLYFTSTRTEGSDVGTLYQVALPGSAPRKIKDAVDSPLSFSPRSDKFAFVRSNAANREYSLVIANADGSGENTLATKRDANSFSVGPTWSPDGKTIVCAVGWWANGYHAQLVEFAVETGREKAIEGRQWYAVLQVAWQQDGKGLIVCAKDQALSPIQLWRVSYPHGEAVKITSDAVDYESVSLPREGNTIASIQGYEVAKLWVAPDGDVERGRGIVSTVGNMWYGVDWTSPGKIVFSSLRGKNLNLSLIDADGSNEKPMTANAGDNYTPGASPDGRFIVFASNRSGTLNIWRINAEDGSDPKQLTFSDGNSYPSVSPDSRWVFYDNQSDNTFTVWKVPIDGGTPIQLTDQYSRMPMVSPDGQFFACRYLVAGGSREIAIFPVSGGHPIERLPIPVMDWQRLQWISGGHALTYIDRVKGVSNIWSYDLASRLPKQLTNFKTGETIFAYAWSPDFKQLACHRGSNIRDVMIMNYAK